MPSFIDFMMEHFDLDQHRFVFITSPKYQYGLQPHHPVEFLYRDEDFITLPSYFDMADKIILHGLWRDKVNDLLVQNKSWLDKTFWIMWGGDFYCHNQYKDNHKTVVSNVAGLISFIPGDINFVRQKYMARGKHFSCFCYPSNIYSGPVNSPKRDNDETGSFVNVMLGHSGVAENNHAYWINQLVYHLNVMVFAPLSYPKNSDYVLDVIAMGKTILGDRFNPMLEFLTREKYEFFLNNIDLAIMPSWRQHGMGNIISLLGRGIPVVMHEETTSKKLLSDMGVEIFSLEQVDTALANIGYREHNAKIIQKYFSVPQLVSDWCTIFKS
ncbi:TDP-N-acetylfucosamine:lipid II N-acetylfucosaminyltransferase [Aeromonas allosaccharophila]|uniref:TDP-N-acetylfucosamine:lipid II N-acetylfucosaminyltransferase n=1 Tax=Aeromonas allosaccharophila TaxID=656 RepID=UPI0013D49D8F|nr:TDP-N-acetylfucosamine:lipid II N-acetylfucosaminyltransferase [Aeromonas allosaccharophila]WDO03846.1 TDP-N-acetylfucosamine:lipid II N-acetylfucosaminyltransferase [Aeromonas allosaccharophila]